MERQGRNRAYADSLPYSAVADGTLEGSLMTVGVKSSRRELSGPGDGRTVSATGGGYDLQGTTTKKVKSVVL
jgi:hypothetical protein